MKRNYLRNVILFLLFIISAMLPKRTALAEAVQLQEEISTDHQENATLNELFSQEYRIIKAYQAILDRVVIGRSSVINMNTKRIYTDRYGGAYVEGKKLVILVVPERSEHAAIVSQSTEEVLIELGVFPVVAQEISHFITIKKADYSLNRLNEVKQYLDQWALDHPEYREIPLSGFGIEEKKNRVVVDFNELNAEIVKKFQNNILHSPTVLLMAPEITKAEAYEAARTPKTVPKEITTSCQFYSGQKIGSQNSAITMTVGTFGFPAYNSKKEIGFVTAGHVAGMIDNAVKINKKKIGKVTEYQYQGGFSYMSAYSLEQNIPNVDAAFITVDDQDAIFQSCSIVPMDIDLFSDPDNIPAQWEVHMVGAYSGLQRGRLLSTNYTSRSSKGDLFDTIKSDYASKGGDSGAAVYLTAFDDLSRLSVLSIHVRSKLTGGVATSVKAKNIYRALNLSAYHS